MKNTKAQKHPKMHFCLFFSFYIGQPLNHTIQVEPHQCPLHKSILPMDLKDLWRFLRIASFENLNFFWVRHVEKNISIFFFFLLYSQENQFFWVKLNIYNFTLTVRTLFDDQRFLQVLFNFRGFEPQPRRYILFLNLILNVFFFIYSNTLESYVINLRCHLSGEP